MTLEAVLRIDVLEGDQQKWQSSGTTTNLIHPFFGLEFAAALGAFKLVFCITMLEGRREMTAKPGD